MIIRSKTEYFAGLIKILFLKLLDYSSKLPVQFRYYLTDSLSLFAFLILYSKRNAVRKNLSHILNRKPSSGEVLKVFTEYGKYWAELPGVTDFWNSAKKIICGPDFPPKEHCFLGVTFHLGNFEVFGNALFQSLGADFNVIAERLRPQFLADYFTTRRLQHHINTLPHDNPKEILKVLRDGKPLGVLCDRNVGSGGVDTRLFGRRVRMPLNLVDYALQKRIPVYVAYCVKDNGALKLFCKKIQSADGFDGMIKEITGILEDVIRSYPYQWHVLSAL
ncbi:MAG: lysophospholipid acyltransferase family protein [Fibrobacter sp.]|nr:lysophospholipid acyltransferase family protein [Fibrobacter sp.]